MKIITAPQPIKVKSINGTNEREVQFAKFMVEVLDGSEPKTLKQIRQLQKIIGALDASNGTVALEDADYEAMKDILNSTRLLPGPARQLLPFFDAVENAETVDKK